MSAIILKSEFHVHTSGDIQVRKYYESLYLNTLLARASNITHDYTITVRFYNSSCSYLW